MNTKIKILLRLNRFHRYGVLAIQMFTRAIRDKTVKITFYLTCSLRMEQDTVIVQLRLIRVGSRVSHR